MMDLVPYVHNQITKFFLAEMYLNFTQAEGVE